MTGNWSGVRFGESALLVVFLYLYICWPSRNGVQTRLTRSSNTLVLWKQHNQPEHAKISGKLLEIFFCLTGENYFVTSEWDNCFLISDFGLRDALKLPWVNLGIFSDNWKAWIVWLFSGLAVESGNKIVVCLLSDLSDILHFWIDLQWYVQVPNLHFLNTLELPLSWLCATFHIEQSKTVNRMSAFRNIYNDYCKW